MLDSAQSRRITAGRGLLARPRELTASETSVGLWFGNMHRLRVALILNGMTFTGSSRVAYEVFSRLNQRLRLRVMSLHDGPMRSRFEQVAPVSILPAQSFFDYLKTDGVRACLSAFPRKPLVKASIALRKPDVVYVNSVCALPALNCLSFGDAGIIVHVHELDRHLRQALRDHSDLLLNRPRRYIAVSNATRDALIRFGVSADRITVVHNSLSREAYADHTQKPRTDGKFVIGGAGDVNWSKGTQLWVQMAAEVVRLVGENAVKFVWLGVDNSGASLEFEETARKLNVWHLIDFLPTNENPMDVFKTFDVLAVSSWEETFSLVALECMSLGKVAVCFADNGGTPEVIGDTGVCVPDFSPRLMAESIVELMKNPERMRRLGAAARERATTRFRLDTQLEAVYDVIMQVAAQRTRPQGAPERA